MVFEGEKKTQLFMRHGEQRRESSRPRGHRLATNCLHCSFACATTADGSQAGPVATIRQLAAVIALCMRDHRSRESGYCFCDSASDGTTSKYANLVQPGSSSRPGPQLSGFFRADGNRRFRRASRRNTKSFSPGSLFLLVSRNKSKPSLNFLTMV